MELSQRVTALETLISGRTRKKTDEGPALASRSLTELKKTIVNREIGKLHDTFETDWAKTADMPCERVLKAIEFVDHHVDAYSKVLEIPASSALKKRVALDLLSEPEDKPDHELRALIDMLVGVANGDHLIAPKTRPSTGKKGGTIRAIRRRFGIC